LFSLPVEQLEEEIERTPTIPKSEP